MARIKLFWVSVVAMAALQACSDPSQVFDNNTEIANHNWSYVNRVKYDVDIADNSIPYNLYFNARVTGNYRYSNLFALVKMTSPGKNAGNALRVQTGQARWRVVRQRHR